MSWVRREVSRRSARVGSSAIHTCASRSAVSSSARVRASTRSFLTLAWLIARTCIGLASTTLATWRRKMPAMANALPVDSNTTRSSAAMLDANSSSASRRMRLPIRLLFFTCASLLLLASPASADPAPTKAIIATNPWGAGERMLIVMGTNDVEEVQIDGNADTLTVDIRVNHGPTSVDNWALPGECTDIGEGALPGSRRFVCADPATSYVMAESDLRGGDDITTVNVTSDIRIQGIGGGGN